ncbi:Rhophilin-1 [Labeo rohita]|uniref:Rhophilin-1 n=1 Tax=Labeo rohita TaxID=84645 RepID=A0ABQ8LNU3_LABRO|nr:Rhophilin-1 [Labeo rohita]
MSDSGSDEDRGSTESVRKGCDPLVSTQRSKLQQRRAKLNQQINRELRLRSGAENLYRASSNQKVKETVALELSFVNSNLQLLKEELEELNSSMNVYQTESETVSVPMIPLGLKETKDIDMTAPLQDFISEHYGEDASLYLNEIRDFMELRQAMRTPSRNEAGQELLTEYYNQLYFLDQRFFSPHRNLGIHFHWYDSLTGVPSVQRALAFEKGSENFSHAPSLDMSSPALSMLVRLMVAQVQECVCEEVILNMQDNNLNMLLQAAQEAARVSDVYSLVLQAMSVPLLKDYVPFSWISMVQVKTHHFRALAHYYTAVALCMSDEDEDEGGEIKALIQIHTRRPDKLDLHDPEDKRRLGKAHLRKAIIRHEEALRLHGVCKMLRKMDILQEVLSHAHACSLEKYSDIDQEDDFCEVAEAPEIHVVRVTDIFHRLGPLSVFSARNRWVRRHACLVRGETGLGLTLRGDSPVLVAGVLPGGCAAEAGLREGDYIVAVNGADCRWAEHAEVERRMNLSPTGDKECQSGSQRRAGREYERGSSSLWNWSWRSSGATKRLGSTFSLSFGNFRENESMF